MKDSIIKATTSFSTEEQQVERIDPLIYNEATNPGLFNENIHSTTNQNKRKEWTYEFEDERIYQTEKRRKQQAPPLTSFLSTFNNTQITTFNTDDFSSSNSGSLNDLEHIQERENLRTRTQEFSEQAFKNAERYIQKASRKVSSILEALDRIVIISEFLADDSSNDSIHSNQSNGHNGSSLANNNHTNNNNTCTTGILNNKTIEENQPLVLLPKEMTGVLKHHQVEGVRFCWTNVVSPPEPNLRGCMLAHPTGLGKTLTLIAFIYVFMKYGKGDKILIVCPRADITNWLLEWNGWLDLFKLTYIPIYNMEHETESKKIDNIAEWNAKGGVLLLSFTNFTEITGWLEKGVIQSEKELEVTKSIYNCDLVILDEAERIINPSTNLAKSLHLIKTRNRIAVTGIRLLNTCYSLNEYFTMINWVRPNYWTKREFTQLFIDPIQLGNEKESTTQEIELMDQRRFVLNAELKNFIHTKDQSVLKQSLPLKKEFVINFGLKPVQTKLYKDCLQSEKTKKSTFYLTSLLQRVSDHPDSARLYCQKRIFDKQTDLGQDENLLNSDSNCILTNMIEKKPNANTSKSELMFQVLGDAHKGENNDDFAWAESVLTSRYRESIIDNSAKMDCLIRIIEQCFIRKEKLLVFSQYIETLDVIEKIITTVNIITGLPLEDEGQPMKRKLSRNLDYLRMDESSSSHIQNMVDTFNSGDALILFLMSTKAGVGVNLTSASRCVLFDVCWDTVWDQQAVFKLYRFGQKKPITVYRFVSHNTMEERLFHKTFFHPWTTKKTLDDKLYFEEFLEKDEFELKENPKQPIDGNVLKNDDLLANILTYNYNITKWVAGVSSHESLYIVDPSLLSNTQQQASHASYTADKERMQDDAREREKSISSHSGSDYSESEEESRSYFESEEEYEEEDDEE
ncbi:hypothetical protein ABK040_002750 [Willaertia magna]